MTDRELLESILKKMDNIDTKLMKLDERVTSMDTKLVQLDERVSSMDTKLDVVTQQVARYNEDIAVLQVTLDTVVAQTAHNARLQPSLDNAVAKIAELETDMKLVKKLIS